MLIGYLLIILSICIYFIIFYLREKISKVLNVFDVPDEKRKIHKSPTPKTASYALAFVFFILIICNFFYKFFEKDVIIVLFGTLTIFLVGLLDDKYRLSAIAKTILLTLTTTFVGNPVPETTCSTYMLLLAPDKTTLGDPIVKAHVCVVVDFCKPVFEPFKT